MPTQTDSRNTVQLVDIFETLGGEEFMVAALKALIKTANKSISELQNISYPLTLSPDDEWAIRNKKLCLICKEKLVEDNGRGGGM